MEKFYYLHLVNDEVPKVFLGILFADENSALEFTYGEVIGNSAKWLKTYGYQETSQIFLENIKNENEFLFDKILWKKIHAEKDASIPDIVMDKINLIINK